MSNIFEQNLHKDFSWDKLGNIEAGRGNLGSDVPVIAYRLLEYTLNDVLNKELGSEKCNDIFRKAGFLAGSALAENMLDLSVGVDEFITALQETMIKLKIGILRIEKYEQETGEIILTVSEDLDCSGLEVSNELVCVYDEGFLQGILESYTKLPYKIREIDCWASGDRVCRFKGIISRE